jgi:Tfp pilus assembly protein PilO
MNRWPHEKIRQAVLLVIGTAAVLGIIWFVAIAPLLGLIKIKADKVALVQLEIKYTYTGIQMADKYREDIQIGQGDLQRLESTMASGDLYRWIINYLTELQNRHDVLVSDFDPPQISELKAPPQVPYKAASFSIGGVANYHDFGAFVADLENTSPFVRLRSLTLQATAPGFAGTTATEKLNFRTDFLTLIKSPTPHP